jgi:hypothetical protein
VPTIDISHDLRGAIGPTRDQLTRPTCLAFAVSDAHATLRPGWQPLSCDYLFFHAQRLTNKSPHRGATSQGVTLALRTEGQPLEKDWPYSANLPSNISLWTAPTGALVFRRDSNASTSDLLAEARAAIKNGKPPVVIMDLTQAFDMPSDSIVSPSPGDPIQHGRRIVSRCVV